MSGQVLVLEAVVKAVGKEEVSLERLLAVIGGVGVADGEGALVMLEWLWRGGFVFCVNPVRGVWKVTRP